MEGPENVPSTGKSSNSSSSPSAGFFAAAACCCVVSSALGSAAEAVLSWGFASEEAIVWDVCLVVVDRGMP